jgi:hypothetical protein
MENNPPIFNNRIPNRKPDINKTDILYIQDILI